MFNPIKFFFSGEETDVKVANNRLLSYAVGLAGQNANYSFVSGKLFVFLNTVLKVDPANTGWIISLSTFWDAINDPIIGTLVDARKFRPGNKLRPYLIWLPPFIGVLTVLMFFDFQLNETATIALILAFYLIYDILYSYQDVALWGMLPLSSPHSEERSRVSQWIAIGAGAGSTITIVFPTIRQVLVGNGLTTEKTAYFLGAVLFGFGGMLISMLAHRMKEKVVYQPEEKNGILKNLASLRHNKTLIIICLARLLAGLSLTLPWEYFFESGSSKLFGMELTGGTFQLIYSIIPGIPGALAMFFSTKIAAKVGGMKRLLVIAEITAIAIRLLCFVIGANGRIEHTAPLLSVMLLVAVMNIPQNMKDIAHRSLISDSIDEVELKTGERTEGISFSMQNFVSKMTGAISKLIQGYLLSWMGFNTNLKDAAGHALEGAALTAAQAPNGRFKRYRWHQFMLGPVIGSVLYLTVILFLKDDRSHMHEVERLLREKRAAAETASDDAVPAAAE